MSWQNLKYFINTIVGTYTPLNNSDTLSSVDFTFIIAGVLFLIIVNWFLKFIYKLFIRR